MKHMNIWVLKDVKVENGDFVKAYVDGVMNMQ